ncbi:protein dpy-30 homolog [Teleopsis dalmanni]|uniref:protein dpy-30 homolog n=1 Tax=Teleopsis dalmanni TaxID=139649 RepID=UPI0018CD02D3|nr:protein dpy-30 homolog [Teleopsis dalmanni]
MSESVSLSTSESTSESEPESDCHFDFGPKSPRIPIHRRDFTSRRDYLKRAVGPILVAGLQAVANERPSDPLYFLAHYLIENKDRFQ